LDELSQVIGRSGRIRPTHHTNDVPRDLNRGKDKSPRESPPTKEKREKCTAELAFGCTGTAGNLGICRPACQNQSRPNAMNLVNVDGTESAAFGTVAAKNLLDLSFQNIGRHLFGNSKDIGIIAAFGIAEFLCAITHTTENRRPAVATFSHRVADCEAEPSTSRCPAGIVSRIPVQGFRGPRSLTTSACASTTSGSRCRA